METAPIQTIHFEGWYQQNLQDPEAELHTLQLAHQNHLELLKVVIGERLQRLGYCPPTLKTQAGYPSLSVPSVSKEERFHCPMRPASTTWRRSSWLGT